MGLKDALAVFDRRGAGVEIRSAHSDITTGRRPKEGFPDVVTLHALISRPSDPRRIGTDVVLTGVADEDVETAKGFFLRYSGERPLESTEHGDVLARGSRRETARVYVKGLFVAEEPNFLFSYNITKLSAPLRRALNRERSNVGRSAYSDRVKAILTACTSTDVAGTLADGLNAYATGRLYDELAWRDVALHACRVLQTNEKVVFATAWQMAAGGAQLRYAQDDGYRIVVVPEDIARSLSGLTDLNGKPLVDLDGYRNEWNASSETMRLNETGNPVLGLWEQAERRIIIRRDQLIEAPGLLTWSLTDEALQGCWPGSFWCFPACRYVSSRREP